jgi:hypothetical protein
MRPMGRDATERQGTILRIKREHLLSVSERTPPIATAIDTDHEVRMTTKGEPSRILFAADHGPQKGRYGALLFLPQRGAVPY